MLTLKSNSTITVIILGIFLIGLLILIQNEYRLAEEETNRLLKAQIADVNLYNEEIAAKKALYIINKGEKDLIQSQIVTFQDSTVFTLLQKLTERENVEIESTFYKGMGIFVESIDGLKNGAEGKFWQYWVNGELPMVAADKMSVKGGDTIEWRFEIISF